MVGQAQATQMVYRFSEGDASMGDLLGGKGSNLCEMTRLGLPVPPGFVITTQVCRDYLAGDYTLPEGLATTDARTNLPSWKSPSGTSSARRPTRCWCRYARGHAFPCRG